jgi:hypothetical protein
MRKTSILALVGAVLVAGSAFASGPGSIQSDLVFTNPNVSAAAGAVGPSTTNNDDSCDISVTPAATLLLPYFEVSPTRPGRTTIFSITNVSPYPQIAHVTLWTDWSFPVLDFNIFLTGYDVQPINLFDVIYNGFIAVDDPNPTLAGTGYNSVNSPAPQTVATGNGVLSGRPRTNTVTVGSTVFVNNPNISPAATSSCAAGNLPGRIPQQLRQDVASLLTTGTTINGSFSCGSSANITSSSPVGGTHTNAIGYMTVDVANNCSTTLPTSPSYYSGEILYDNVLIGDYQDVNQTATGLGPGDAGGNTMVHIRAVPEGGAAGVFPAATGPTNLPYTFYDRYTLGNATGVRTIDRRQPLPSTFAARWISGSSAAFDTNYKIWREGITSATSCSNAVLNSALAVADVVRFDERENSTGLIPTSGPIISPPPVAQAVGLPETSKVNVSNATFFPPASVVAGTTAGGWMYLNLTNNFNDLSGAGGASTGVYSAARPGFGATNLGGGVTNVRASQNWVIINESANGIYSVDFDAAHLGNGCSPATNTGAQVNPAGGTLVCPGPGYGCTAVAGVYTNTSNTSVTGPAGTNQTP